MADGAEQLALDAATLRAELDARWPDATGARRATVDERHRLVLLHPEYDGFVTLHVTARCDLDGVFVLPHPVLERCVTAHHRTGPLARGQGLPIDLELHPGNVGRPATSGVLELVDVEGEAIAPPIRVTLASDDSLSCVLAGFDDGPLPSDEFELAAAELLDGTISARQLAARIEPELRPRRWWRR